MFTLRDRVKLIIPYGHLEVGQLGLIVEVDKWKDIDTDIGVEWEISSELNHPMDGLAETGQGYYVPSRCLVKAEKCKGCSGEGCRQKEITIKNEATGVDVPAYIPVECEDCKGKGYVFPSKD